MIYLDTSYLTKCYLTESGSAAVREWVASQSSIACCEYGRLELVTSFHRNLREGFLTRKEHEIVLRQFHSDDASGIWIWLGIDAGLLRKAISKVATLPPAVFIRAGDALHLVCAAENGCSEIYSNDRHMIAAARHFGLKARNVIVQPR